MTAPLASTGVVMLPGPQPHSSIDNGQHQGTNSTNWLFRTGCNRIRVTRRCCRVWLSQLVEFVRCCLFRCSPPTLGAGLSQKRPRKGRDWLGNPSELSARAHYVR